MVKKLNRIGGAAFAALMLQTAAVYAPINTVSAAANEITTAIDISSGTLSETYSGVTWDADSLTLTLDSVHINLGMDDTDSYPLKLPEGDVTVICKGDCAITGGKCAIGAPSTSEGSITIKGESKADTLTITGGGAVLNNTGNVVSIPEMRIENITFSSDTKSWLGKYYGFRGLAMHDSDISVKTASMGIESSGWLEIINCNVSVENAAGETVNAQFYCGKQDKEHGMLIKDTTMTVKCNNIAICGWYMDIWIENCELDLSDSTCGIYAEEDCVIVDSTVIGPPGRNAIVYYVQGTPSGNIIIKGDTKVDGQIKSGSAGVVVPDYGNITIENTEGINSIVLDKNGDRTVYGEVTLTSPLTIPEGKTLTIAEGAALTLANESDIIISEGAELNGTGTITNNGKGDLINYGTVSGAAVSVRVLNHGEISGGSFSDVHEVESDGVISGGEFDCPVFNLIEGEDDTTNGTITGGVFNGVVFTAGGDISADIGMLLETDIEEQTSVLKLNGVDIDNTLLQNENFAEALEMAGEIVFEGNSTISAYFVLNDKPVTVNGSLTTEDFFKTNKITISEGAELTANFTLDSADILNRGTISGTVRGNVTNEGEIKDGSFSKVINNGIINDGEFNDQVTNCGVIKGGTFDGTVSNSLLNNSGELTWGSVEDGIFNNTVSNLGEISGGVFAGEVNNRVSDSHAGEINGGEFKADVNNEGTITDGKFEKPVTGGIIDPSDAHEHYGAVVGGVYICNLCGKEYCGDTHTFGEYIKVDDDTHSRTCSICGTVESAAHGWDEGKVTKQPTTEETGIKTYTCIFCGAAKTEEIPKLEPEKPAPTDPEKPETEKTAAPVITPNGGSFTGSVKVTLTAEEGADIYYTTDGSAPTAESTKYTGEFTLTSTATVKAIAIKEGKTVSDAVSAAFTKRTSTGGTTRPNRRPSTGTDTTSDNTSAVGSPTVNGTAYCWTAVSSSIGGEKQIRFTLGAGSDNPAVNLGAGESGKLASLMRLDSEGKPECVSAAKVSADGSVSLRADGAGEYFIVLDIETKLKGDADNNGTVNSLDAAIILKNTADGVVMSLVKLDVNGDGLVNALDAAAILKAMANA